MFEDKETETFFTVVHMFQRSAMANLGLLEHPAGGLHFNFSEAKDIIDILRMLQNKTQGNLDASAEAMLKGSLVNCKCSLCKRQSGKSRWKKNKRTWKMYVKPSKTLGTLPLKTFQAKNDMIPNQFIGPLMSKSGFRRNGRDVLR